MLLKLLLVLFGQLAINNAFREMYVQLFWEQTEYLGWLEKAEDKFSARCKMCAITFDVLNMGEAALKTMPKGRNIVGWLAKKRKQQD